MSGIGIISNPLSLQNREDPARLSQLAYILGDKGSCVAADSLEGLSQVAREFKKREIEILAINGGDGTIHKTLSHFIQAYGETPLPKIALLTGGTMNNIATSLGIRGFPGKILKQVVDKYHSGGEFEIVRTGLLKIDDNYGFIFGNGLITNFLQQLYNMGKPSPFEIALFAIRMLGSTLVGGSFSKPFFKPVPVQVNAEGEDWPFGEYLGLMTATISDIGFRFRPFTRLGERENSFQLVGIVSSPRRTMWEVLRIYLGLPLHPKSFIEEVTSKVIFQNEDEWVYTIDGDIYKAQGQTILEAGPQVNMIIR